MQVLVVDDDVIARWPLAYQLSRHPGVTSVVEASDGEEAWALLNGSLRPVMCLCDLVMPGMSGLDLLRRTRGLPKLANLPFVMISSAADRASVEQAMTGGAAGFIVKPFSAALVAQTVEKVLAPLRPRERKLPRVIDPDRVRVAARLWSELQATQDKLAAGAGLDEVGVSLRRLHSGSLVLGLHSCSEFLVRAADPATGAGERENLVREAGKLLKQHVQAMARGA